MAWKNPKDEMQTEETNSSSINLIGSGTIIKGDVSSDGDLRIDGKVIGTITSKSKVVVGATGVVEGEIKSQNTDIYGSHKGNVHAQDMVFLKATAHLIGDISTSKIVIEAGAVFSGKCIMGTGAATGSSNALDTTSTAALSGSKGTATGDASSITENSKNEPKSGEKGFEKIYS